MCAFVFQNAVIAVMEKSYIETLTLLLLACIQGKISGLALVAAPTVCTLTVTMHELKLNLH